MYIYVVNGECQKLLINFVFYIAFCVLDYCQFQQQHKKRISFNCSYWLNSDLNIESWLVDLTYSIVNGHPWLVDLTRSIVNCGRWLANLVHFILILTPVIGWFYTQFIWVLLIGLLMCFMWFYFYVVIYGFKLLVCFYSFLIRRISIIKRK